MYLFILTAMRYLMNNPGYKILIIYEFLNMIEIGQIAYLVTVNDI